MSKIKKKFLIIGSNSFSGASFINLILSKKYEIIGVSRSNEIKKEFLLYRCNQNLKLFKFYKIDINKNKDRNRLYKIIKKFKPHYIINYSAQGMVAQSWAYPEDWYMTNLVSQSILYKNLMKFKFIKKMIHFTTPEVYGSNKKVVKENFNFKPSTPYAVSRAAMDYHLMNFQKNYGLPIIFTRTANIFGPGQQLYRIIPKTFMCAKKKIKLNLHGGGKSIRSFIYMDDVSKATFLILTKGKIGSTYHISTNSFFSIKSVVKKISSIEKVRFKKLFRNEKDRMGKDHSYRLNSSKLKKLGWRPEISFELGLNHTKKWIEKNFKFFKTKKLIYRHKK